MATNEYASMPKVTTLADTDLIHGVQRSTGVDTDVLIPFSDLQNIILEGEDESKVVYTDKVQTITNKTIGDLNLVAIATPLALTANNFSLTAALLAGKSIISIASSTADDWIIGIPALGAAADGRVFFIDNIPTSGTARRVRLQPYTGTSTLAGNPITVAANTCGFFKYKHAATPVLNMPQQYPTDETTIPGLSIDALLSLPMMYGMIGKYLDVSLADDDVDFSEITNPPLLVNFTAGHAINALILPALEGNIVFCRTVDAGGDCNVTDPSGTPVTIPSGMPAILWHNGTDYVNLLPYFANTNSVQTLTNKIIQDSTIIPKNTAVANAVASALTTNLAGTNNDLVYTAKVKGEDGDDISVEYLGGEDQSFAITVTGNKISVQCATTGTTITTVADDISAEITSGVTAGGIAANALVTCVDKADNDGSEVVIAMEETNLAGGVNGTVGLEGEHRNDLANSKVWVATADNTIADANWKYYTLT